MFQPRVSGIEQMYLQIAPVMTVVADEAAIKAALASGQNSLASVVAALQNAQDLKVDLAAMSQNGTPSEIAYAAALSPKIDAVIKTVSQCPVAVKNLLSGNPTDQIKDGSGNTVTVGSFSLSGNYNWSSPVANGNYNYPSVGWVHIDGSGNINGASGISVSESTDTHNNTSMNASGAGSAVEGYTYVQMSSAATAAINDLQNSF